MHTWSCRPGALQSTSCSNLLPVCVNKTAYLHYSQGIPPAQDTLANRSHIPATEQSQADTYQPALVSSMERTW